MKSIRQTWVFALLFSALIVASCKDDPDPPTPDPSTFQLNFSLKWGANTLDPDSIYQEADGRTYQVAELKAYISNVALVKPDQSTQLVKDVALLDLLKPNTFSVSGEVPAGSYVGLRFNLGLDSIKNHTDPSNYPVTHPMSAANSMYWSWFTNYIFTKFEGRVDSAGWTQQQLLLYHTGLDSMVQDLSYTGLNFVIAEGETETHTLVLDARKILFNPADPIDTRLDSMTHTTDDPALAARIIRNFKAAMQ